ncbi:hypothetical protein CYY_004048 [Polysphondylium violaceum]|uniref:WD40 repeat-containing protein n=1 Tax=Polysphondylium violaceum TaxID=133409 RepID=A0A8J4V0P8_9MYCE|nr:hypothetical protein CYY_004048 [Polysphondylium violaceum]
MTSNSKLVTTSREIPNHFLESIKIQYDWELAYKQDTDNFWVSYQKELKNIVHGSIRSTRQSNNKFLFESDQGFKLDIQENLNHIKIGCEKYTTNIYSPYQVHKVLNGKKRIMSMGVSSMGELGVYGSTDGILEVFEISDGQVRRKLDGHAGDVDFSMFFPSGTVILSGAGDGRLKIWDALDGSCAQTLVGHTGGIISASLVDRGRNIVSASRDGTSKLWDVPSASVIHTLCKLSRPVNDCFVASSLLESTNNTGEKTDEREVGTQGKTVVLAAEEGFLQIYDLRSKNMVSQLDIPLLSEQTRPVAFNACHVHNSLIVGGDHVGNIYLWDKRNLSTPFSRLQFSNSPIHHIKSNTSAKSSNSFWVTSGDGSVFLLDLDKNSITTSLSGIDTDVVTSFNVVKDMAFTTSRDSIIRCYNKLNL